MKENIQKFHNDTISMHQAILFDTLVFPHNITSESVKAFVFEDNEGCETEQMRGYLAIKENNGKRVKYFIDEQFYDEMPLRVVDTEELYMKESTTRKSIVLRPLNPIPFRIRAEKCFTDEHEFIEQLAPFDHTHPDDFTLLKMIAIMGYVGKTFIGCCSSSEFGKSSMFTIIHGITQKSIVYQPRSDAGVLIQINEDGNMVFDEVHECDSKTKKCIENFTLQVTANVPVYINGAVKASYLKQKYDVTQQSITYLYNLYSYYKNPESEFFDNMFSNNKAVHSRILKLKFDGMLTEKFDKDFDIIKVAEQNKMYYMQIAKHLLWLKRIKLSNLYQRRYNYDSNLIVRGRKKLIYDEITWMIDMYSRNEEEYKKFIAVLDKCINDYQDMVGGGIYHFDNSGNVQKVLEETIKYSPLDFIKSKPNGECNIDEFLDGYSEKEMNIMLRNGDIYLHNPSTIRVLE